MFSSLREVSQTLGTNSVSIQKCCSAKQKRAYEFEHVFDEKADCRPDQVWSVAAHSDPGAPLAPLQVSSHGGVKSQYGKVSHCFFTLYR